MGSWSARCLAVASAAALLVGVPVIDAARADAPRPVSGEDRTVPVADGEAVPAAQAGAPASGPLAAARPEVLELPVGSSTMVGVTFDDAPEATAVQVRVQDADGGWGPWSTLPVEGGPDPGSGEAGRATAASAPLWVGEGDADRTVQVRLPEADVDEAALAVVDGGSSPADDDAADRGPVATATAAAIGMPVTRSRAAWGADESLRGCDADVAPTLKAAVVHHTAGSNAYTEDQVPSVIRGLYRYHTQSQGWCDLGYNVVVDRFGGLWEGRAGGLDRAVVGAHAGGYNSGTFGISMIGDYTSAPPSGATVAAVARAIAWKFGGSYRTAGSTVQLTSAGGGTARWPAGDTRAFPRIMGHRDVGRTACAGDGGYGVLPALRDQVRVLIGDPSGPVYDGWRARGGAGGPMGEPSATEGGPLLAGGRYNHFQGSSLYWSPATGDRAVGGPIRDTWAALGWEHSALVYPTTDERGTPDGRGRYNHFQGGSIYWTGATGAREVRGGIRSAWAALGWERSSLGYPTTNESGVPDGRGRYNHFQGGSIYWTSATGARDVRGPIRDRWAALGWERSTLGYPTTGQQSLTGGGRYNHFQRGSIYWTSATGAHAVVGAARDAWAARGWERSALGYPTTSTTAAADGNGTVTRFQRGTIRVDRRGAVTVKAS